MGEDSALSSSSFWSVCFCFRFALRHFSCFFSCLFFLSVSFVSFPGVLSFFAVPEGLVPVVPCRFSCHDCRLSLSLALFLVVCKCSVFALALLLSLAVVLCAPGTCFPLWVFIHFFLWYTLSLLCVSPFCCPFIRLSPGFFYLLFLLVSLLYSMLLFFAAVALSLGVSASVRVATFSLFFFFFSFFFFWPFSLFSDGFPYVAFALFLPSLGLCLRFSLRFLSFHRMCARMCQFLQLSFSSPFLPLFFCFGD